MTTTLLLAYVLAPLGHRPDGSGAVWLALSLLITVAVMGMQIRAITRSTLPALRAVEAVAVTIPAFLLLFATTYFVAGSADPASFTEPVSRLDAVYFTVTVFATVGFGDIAAVTETARAIVTVQMLADLVLIGLVAKVLVEVVQRRRHDLASAQSPPDSDGDAPS